MIQIQGHSFSSYKVGHVSLLKSQSMSTILFVLYTNTHIDSIPFHQSNEYKMLMSPNLIANV